MPLSPRLDADHVRQGNIQNTYRFWGLRWLNIHGVRNFHVLVCEDRLRRRTRLTNYAGCQSYTQVRASYALCVAQNTMLRETDALRRRETRAGAGTPSSLIWTPRWSSDAATSDRSSALDAVPWKGWILAVEALRHLPERIHLDSMGTDQTMQNSHGAQTLRFSSSDQASKDNDRELRS